LAKALSIFHDLALEETAATGAKRRWDTKGARMPTVSNHWKNKGADTNVKRIKSPLNMDHYFSLIR